jgi:hypothetical protein
MPDPLPPEELLRRKLERAQIELSQLRSMNKRLLRQGGVNVEGVVGEMLEMLKGDRELILSPIKYKPISLKKELPINPGHKETLAAAWSDFHIAETVNLEDSNGINVYNSIIGANRFWDHVQTQKKIATIHSSLYPIEQYWIQMLGDMISGSIHEELRLTNDLTDQAAIILASRLLQMGIVEIKALGIPIRIDTVVGNHPRTTIKVPTKQQARTSMDWVLYEMLATHFAKDDQVDIHVHTGQLAVVNQYGWRYVLEHGIDWKNGAEEAFEDRIRALFDDPVYRKATGLTGAAFDQIVIGNLHKPAFLERTIKNGSLIGQNELGQAWRLKPIKAAQLMWGISKSHVRTWEYQVDLTDVKSDKADNPFSEYAKWFVKRHGR